MELSHLVAQKWGDMTWTLKLERGVPLIWTSHNFCSILSHVKGKSATPKGLKLRHKFMMKPVLNGMKVSIHRPTQSRNFSRPRGAPGCHVGVMLSNWVLTGLGQIQPCQHPANSSDVDVLFIGTFWTKSEDSKHAGNGVLPSCYIFFSTPFIFLWLWYQWC